MCVLFSYVLIGCLLGRADRVPDGSAVTRQADIDINRIKLISNEAYPEYQTHPRSYREPHYFKRSHDHDDRSRRVVQPRASVQPLHDAHQMPTAKTQVHQPREDPRLFYQSDAYIQENYRKNVDREVAAIYPGIEVIRAGDKHYAPRTLAMRSDRSTNRIDAGYSNICVKCPADRTVIAKPGSDRVLLQNPRLKTCSGRQAPRDVRFTPLYGPKFGSLITQGSHAIIGRISHKNKDIQMCKMQVHVIVQTCSVPNYLISKCDDRTKVCQFSCREPNLELHGHSALSCGDNMGWIGWTGNLPICRARTWCERPAPPDHGRISCRGSHEASGLAEGSTCRLRCARGWHWSPRAATVCRRGNWTFNLTCEAKRTYNAK